MTARRLLAFAPLFALLLLLASPAPALAQNDLAEENTQLKERVTELEERLERANQQIKALSEEIKRLRSMRTGDKPADNGPAKDGPGEPEIKLIENPFASASDYVQSLRFAYDEQFETLDPNDNRARGTRIREIRRWAGDVRRDMQGKIEWEVQLDTTSGPAVGRIEATFRSLGSITGQPEGEPFTVRLPADDLRTLRDADATTVWILVGELSPRIGVETDRMTEEDTGRGIFIGPMAELFLDLKVDSISRK